MTPFLKLIAERFYNEYGNTLYKLQFVFPNRRAGVFFQKYLTEIANAPLFSPTITTIQEVFVSMSSYKLADKIQLLVILYKHYKQLSQTSETFDDFLFWGDMLINDFNDVDKHLVDARKLFRNIESLSEMEDDFAYLSEEQREVIERYLQIFKPSPNEDSTKEAFLKTWAILLDLYTQFREDLHEQGLAYEGMIYRDVCENVLKGDAQPALPSSKIVFVGLNMLTTSEKKLLTYLKNNGVADFYWDYSNKMVSDKSNKASLNIDENLQKFPSAFPIEEPQPEGEAQPTEITLVGIPSGIGQAKHLTTILSELNAAAPQQPGFDWVNTAVVLPDENLLLPVLYSIPPDIQNINVTMGYNMANASVASLVEILNLLQKNRRDTNGQVIYYHKNVLALLNHSLVKQVLGKTADDIKSDIIKYNRIVISSTDLLGSHAENSFLKLVFQPVDTWQQAVGYLEAILQSIYTTLTAISAHNKELDEEQDKVDVRPIDLEREFIVQYYKTVVRLSDLLSTDTDMQVTTFFKLLKRLIENISVAFEGEPLSGLQVMGVLETRALDFENIILLSMNEGVFPLKKSTSSYVPYNLRKAFGMPTYEHQDSTYAYHFYRMISRAKQVFMLYDTRTEDMQTGEVSRYFYQLKYLYGDSVVIREETVPCRITSVDETKIEVKKTPDVMAKLNAFKQGGSRNLSASNLNEFIACPLRFYLNTVERVREEDEIQESIEATVFGTIFHAMMQDIYDRIKANKITTNILTEVINNDKFQTELLVKLFKENYYKSKTEITQLEGQHYVIGEIIRSYVKQTLKQDMRLCGFTYEASEYSGQVDYPVTDDLCVRLKYIIDRIDNVNGTTRIIDYKTGNDELSCPSVESLFDRENKKRNKAIFQLLMYGMMYRKENPKQTLEPHIYKIKEVFAQDFQTKISIKTNPDLSDMSVVLTDFEERFKDVIAEIFDPELSFTQASDESACTYCPYLAICRRTPQYSGGR